MWQAPSISSVLLRFCSGCWLCAVFTGACSHLLWWQVAALTGTDDVSGLLAASQKENRQLRAENQQLAVSYTPPPHSAIPCRFDPAESAAAC